MDPQQFFYVALAIAAIISTGATLFLCFMLYRKNFRSPNYSKRTIEHLESNVSHIVERYRELEQELLQLKIELYAVISQDENRTDEERKKYFEKAKDCEAMLEEWKD